MAWVVEEVMVVGVAVARAMARVEVVEMVVAAAKVAAINFCRWPGRMVRSSFAIRSLRLMSNSTISTDDGWHP